MINVPPVGSKCLVTFPKHFPNHNFEMVIVDKDVKDDCFGTIKYQITKIRNKRTFFDGEHIEEISPVNHFSVVEDLWFDEELTGRKVQIIN